MISRRISRSSLASCKLWHSWVLTWSYMISDTSRSSLASCKYISNFHNFIADCPFVCHPSFILPPSIHHLHRQVRIHSFIALRVTSARANDSVSFITAWFYCIILLLCLLCCFFSVMLLLHDFIIYFIATACMFSFSFSARNSMADDSATESITESVAWFNIS